MAQQTYTARVIVLRKTKLGETDLILSLLAQNGSQLRAVAKGARRPSSQFASRLELGAEADVLFARGRSLDIVKEVRLCAGNGALRQSIERTAAATPMLELLDRITQADLENPKLFACTSAALCALDGADALHAPAISAAHLLKTFAFAGVRPTLDSCCLCGQPIDAQQADAQVQGIAFSYAEGGVECQACVTPDAVRINAAIISWARALLGMRFSDIAHTDIDQSSIFGVLRLCQAWAHMHASTNLKSLAFLFTCGLF